MNMPFNFSEIVGVGDKRKRGRPGNAPGALAGPKTFSISNQPNSILRNHVAIDNLVGSVVSYSHTTKEWYVRFPLTLDDNGDPTVRSFNATQILKGIEVYKNNYK